MSGERLTPICEARRIIAVLIREYQATGRPIADCPCGGPDGCRRCRAIDRAIEKIAQRMELGARPKSQRCASPRKVGYLT